MSWDSALAPPVLGLGLAPASPASRVAHSLPLAAGVALRLLCLSRTPGRKVPSVGVADCSVAAGMLAWQGLWKVLVVAALEELVVAVLVVSAATPWATCRKGWGRLTVVAMWHQGS